MTGFVGGLTGRPARLWSAPGASAAAAGCRVLLRGFIANRREVAAKTGSAADAGALSDAELFARADRKWGADLSRHVLGEYAVAVFDPSGPRLVLTHDTFGIVPLYYTTSPSGAPPVFGSHLDALVAAIGPGEIDDEYLVDYLVLTRGASDRTPYKAISRLLPGQALEWTPGRRQLIQGYHLDTPPTVACRTAEDYMERFRELARDAVATSLPESGRFWCELSGGLDSSTITCLAARLPTVARLGVVSAVYSQSSSSSERRWIDAVRRRYDFDWHALDVDLDAPFSSLPDRFVGEPNAAVPLWSSYRRYQELAAANGIDVVLSGDGGDHALLADAPTPDYLADYLRRWSWRRLISELRAWQNQPGGRRSPGYLFYTHALQPLRRHLRGIRVSDVPPRLPPWLHPEVSRRYSRAGTQRSDLPVRHRAVGDQAYHERIWEFAAAAGTNRCQIVNRFGFRHPLLYRPLVEFMFAVPWPEKLHPTQDRHLHRRAMQGILPAPIRRRHTKGGSAEAYFTGFARASAWHDLLRTQPRLVERGLVDSNAWQQAIAQARVGFAGIMSQFVSAAVVEFWLQQLPRHAERPELRRAVLESATLSASATA